MTKKDTYKKDRQSKTSAPAPAAAHATKGKGIARLMPYTGWALVALMLAGIFVYTVAQETDFLWRVQELNLFLYTATFFQQQMVVAGGLLTWAGTYFTQYFYHPWLGTLLLCLWTALLLWLTQRAFRLPHRWAVVLLVPLVLVMVSDFMLGYWIFQMKLRGYFFIAVIGLSAAVASVWGFRCLPWRFALPLLCMAVTAIGGYPLLGCYALLATALMALMSWRLHTTLTMKAVASVLAALLVVCVPMVYYRHVYYQAASDMVWWQALPLFNNGDPYPQYYWPFALLALFYAVMALCYGLKRTPRLFGTTAGWAFTQLGVAAAAVYGCCHFWYSDANFHKELRMEASLERLDWQGVLDQAITNHDRPTRLMWMYKNLAVFKLGRAGDELYNYPEGDAKPNCPFGIPMVVQAGKRLYLEYGFENYCYRWCMEDGVEYGWRVDYLKNLSLCSLLNGEPVLAQKYLDLLKKTKYYADWARHYEQYVTRPELIAKDPRLGPIQPLMQYESVLASDKSVIETFLLGHLSSLRTTSPLLAELAAVSALQQKDIPTFWRAFTQYIATHPNQRMPRHLQEAAFLFGNLEHQVDISRMPFDPSIPESYQQFMQAAQQLAGMNEQQIANALRSRFGHTYYFDYFLARGLQTY